MFCIFCRFKFEATNAISCLTSTPSEVAKQSFLLIWKYNLVVLLPAPNQKSQENFSVCQPWNIEGRSKRPPGVYLSFPKFTKKLQIRWMWHHSDVSGIKLDGIGSLCYGKTSKEKSLSSGQTSLWPTAPYPLFFVGKCIFNGQNKIYTRSQTKIC